MRAIARAKCQGGHGSAIQTPFTSQGPAESAFTTQVGAHRIRECLPGPHSSQGPACRTVSPVQHGQCLDLLRLRKHVEQLDVNHAVAAGFKPENVAQQRVRLARKVRDPRRFDLQ